MNFQELKIILRRLYLEYVKKRINRIIIALFLSIIVAGSTSGIMATWSSSKKNIYWARQNFCLVYTFLIVLAFTSKGLSLYFARLNLIRVGEEVAGELKKKIANNILLSDVQTLENRHSENIYQILCLIPLKFKVSLALEF